MQAPPGIQVEWVDSEAVALDPATGELHYLNDAAALTYALIQELGYESALADLNARYEEDSPFLLALPDLVEGLVAKRLLIE